LLPTHRTEAIQQGGSVFFVELSLVQL